MRGKIGYTEFSFGYAFTENLIRSSRSAPTGAPTFPNLIQEAQLGYDVRLDFPARALFFQYKLPELMVKNTASEIKMGLAGISIPFFRMSLMRRDLSSQHRRLIRLEGRRPRSVFYATPCMENAADFNTEYNNAGVHLRSVFFSPSAIGHLPDDRPHVIAYKAGQRFGWFRSDPRKIPMENFKQLDGTVRASLEEDKGKNLNEVSREILKEVREIANPAMRQYESAIRERVRARRAALGTAAEISSATAEVVEDLLVSREIARVDLGVDLLIAQPSAK